MRYFLFSALVHGMIVLAGISLVKDTFSFDMVGDPTVTFSMVGESSQMSGRASDMVTAKPQAPEPKTKTENPKPVKKKPQEEVVKKPEPEKVPEEVIQEPLVEEVPVKEVEETPTKESIAEESETTETEVETPSQEERDAGDTETASTDTPQNTQGEAALGEGLVQLDDGSIAAKNQGIKGLSYGFLSQPEPNYPNIARRMGIKEEVVIKVRFLIGYDGRVEDIRFYDKVENFGFREEVEKALRGWRATPIEVNGKQVKLYFYKAFKFERLS